MAPPNRNPEYIPPTYGELFQDTYLTSHRQKMQLAIQLAQQELQTQQAMLQYYQKKEKQYLDYIEEVGTAGAGRSGGRVTDKQFERQLAALKLKQSVKQDADKRELQIIKFVEDEYSVPVGATGSINQQARQAALNLSASMSNANTAIRGTTGFKPGTTQALAAALTFYSEMKAQANLAGRGTQFQANDAAIRSSIANHFGVQGMNGEALMLAPQGFQTMKDNRAAALKSQIGGQSLSNAELRDIEAKAGLQPGTISTSGGIKPSQTAQEQEDFLASRLKEVQTKMTKLEDEIGQRSNAEDLMKRARQIYTSEFASNARRSKGAAAQKKMRNVTPEQMFYIDALQSVASDPRDVSVYIDGMITEDDSPIERKAFELMNAIINNKGSGKAINVAKLAAELDPKNAELITGLAIKGFLAHEKRDDPIKKLAEEQAKEVEIAAVDGALAENADDKDVLTEQFKEEQKKEKLIQELKTEVENGQIVPFEEGRLAFKDEAALDAFLAKKEADGDTLTKEEVREILGGTQIISEEDIEAIARRSGPLAPEPVMIPLQTQFKLPYGNKGKEYGYHLILLVS